MYKIAIMEDEKSFSEKLKEYIKKAFEKEKMDYEISIFANPVDFFSSFNNQYDLIFSDIDMPLMNGYEASKRIREVDTKVTLVFITQLTQYAVNGYEVDATDYILKPIDYESFSLKMVRIFNRIRKRAPSSFAISTSNGQVKIILDELLYISSDDHFLELGTIKETLNTFGSLKKIEKNLDSRFIRCHTSFIVNIAYVDRIGKTSLILKNGKEILISRARRKDFLQAMQQFFIEGGM